MYALAWHEDGQTFLVIYTDAAQARRNLVKALEVDPSAKLAGDDPEEIERVQDDIIDLSWDGSGEIPF